MLSQTDIIKTIKRINRQNDLQAQQQSGFRRSKVWGGKPTAKQNRRNRHKMISESRS